MDKLVSDREIRAAKRFLRVMVAAAVVGAVGAVLSAAQNGGWTTVNFNAVLGAAGLAALLALDKWLRDPGYDTPEDDGAIPP